MNWLRLGQFLRLVDDDGSGLNLTDVAFIAIITKIMFSASIDFPAVVTLATVCINKMHKRSQDMADDSEDVKNMSQQISDLKDKVSPILDKLKGAQ